MPALLLRAVLPVGILAAGVVAYLILSVEPEQTKAPPTPPQPVRTRVVELLAQNYPVIIRTHGIVQPHTEISLSSQVAGRITRLSPSFDDGAFFSAGEVLVELEAEDYQTALAVAEARLLGAEAALQLARVNHERNSEIFRENLISQAEVDLTAANLKQATADLNSATAQADRARRDLDRTKIRAPFDGRVRSRQAGLGQLVGTGSPLGVIFTVDYAEVRLPVAGTELPFLVLPDSAESSRVEVELRNALDPAGTESWSARIIRTEGTLNESTLELFVIARVDDPFGRRSGRAPLRIGQPVVGLIPGRVLEGVMALPRVAVRQLDQIFLVDKTELTLKARTIVPLWSDETHIVIRDPEIANGSLLATTHLVYAPDGAKVEIIPDIDSAPATADVTSNTIIKPNQGAIAKPDKKS